MRREKKKKVTRLLFTGRQLTKDRTSFFLRERNYTFPVPLNQEVGLNRTLQLLIFLYKNTNKLRYILTVNVPCLRNFIHSYLLKNTSAKLAPCLNMAVHSSTLFYLNTLIRLFASLLTGFLTLPPQRQRKNKNQEKKSAAKSGVIISTCGAKSLKGSPMFGHLSLARDRVSGRDKKTFSTFVSGMKESHLSLATVENSCDTVDQTRLPESAGGVRMAKYLQFLQQMGHCATPALV